MNWLKRLLGINTDVPRQQQEPKREKPEQRAPVLHRPELQSTLPKKPPEKSNENLKRPLDRLNPYISPPPARRRDGASLTDPLNPLNPLSPLWVGASNDGNNSRCDAPSSHTRHGDTPSYSSHDHHGGSSYGGGGSSHDSGSYSDSGSGGGGCDISSDPALDNVRRPAFRM